MENTNKQFERTPVTISKPTKWVLLTLSGAFLLLSMVQLIAPSVSSYSGMSGVEIAQKKFDDTLSSLKEAEHQESLARQNTESKKQLHQIAECELAGAKLKEYDKKAESKSTVQGWVDKAYSGCGIKPVLK